MESYIQNTAIVLGIILNIFGVLLSLAYIYKSCNAEDLPVNVKNNYYDQVSSCFKWGNALILFIWLVTSADTNKLIFSGIKLGIYLWALVLILSISCMLVKLIARSIDTECASSLRKMSTRSMRYLALLIFLFWFIT
ncbi:MAG TPA: hypothetical protein GXZ27_01155 [Thermoanaerobacterales bacterium]|jgi:hypothetical protein|nr:hypothetical protein [Thermoanaerobacterales bacterium]